MIGLQDLFRCASDRSRRRKLQLFMSAMMPTRTMRVLDLGGEVASPTQPCLQLLDVYPWPRQVVLVNLCRSNVATAARQGASAVCADGLRLPFDDGSFDVCYCNAVIEHVSTHANQVKLAREIMRVSRRWFVTTPNRWFPFEPHLRLPLVNWLPVNWMRAIGLRFGYNHLRRHYQSGMDCGDLCPLSRSGLAALFPGSRVVGNGFLGWAPSLVALGPKLAIQTVRPAPATDLTMTAARPALWKSASYAIESAPQARPDPRREPAGSLRPPALADRPVSGRRRPPRQCDLPEDV